MALAYDNSYQDPDDGRVKRNKFYGLVNYYHSFEGEGEVSINGMGFKNGYHDNDFIGLSLGGSHNWADEQFSVYGEVGARSTTRGSEFGKQYGLNGELGFRVAF